MDVWSPVFNTGLYSSWVPVALMGMFSAQPSLSDKAMHVAKFME